MESQFSRTELLIGQDSMEKLNNSTVAIFGIGGVGGYVVESLARTGIGHFVLVDNDDVSLTNINRQIIATHDTIGQSKCEVMKNRILSINPNATVEVHQCFFLPANQDEFDFTKYDYVVDAVDTVTAKIAIVMKAINNNVKVISAMGAGNKLNPAMLQVSDIYKTKVDPLAKVMRTELKKRRVKKLKVVYSLERAMKTINDETLANGKKVPGSTAFVPSAMGLIIASEIVKDLTGIRNEEVGA